MLLWKSHWCRVMRLRLEKWRSMKGSWGLSGDLPVTVVREVWTLVIKQSIMASDNLPPVSLTPHHHHQHIQDHQDSHHINAQWLFVIVQS